MRRHGKAVSGGASFGRRKLAGLLGLAIITVLVIGAASAGADAPPTLTINPASEIGITSAHVSGTINPNGGPASEFWTIQYSTEPADPGSWISGPSGEISGPEAESTTPIAVAGKLEGLHADQKYSLRLSVFLASTGTVVTTEAPYPSLTTEPAPNAPTLTLNPATAVSFQSAHIAGSIDPEGGNVSSFSGTVPIVWQLQYSHDPTSEGWSLGGNGEISGAEAEGTDPIAVAADLAGLQPGTGYVFRLNVFYAGLEENSAEPNPGFETLAVAVPAVTLGVPTEIGGTVHLTGEINPGGSDPAFNVHYHFQCEPECAGLEGEVPADTSGHQISVETTSLLPLTEYQITLLASNAGGQAEAGPESFTTTAIAPTATALPVGPVTDITAVVGGNINPNASLTTYFIQYATKADFSDAQRYPVSEELTVGSGRNPMLVSQRISGLAPSTEYFFRLVAVNTAGPSTSAPLSFRTSAASAGCPNEGVRSESNLNPINGTPYSLGLPDCRAFEMVSPVDKHSTKAELIAPSPNGERVEMDSGGAWGDAKGQSLSNTYVAQRSSGGWTTVGLIPPPELSRIYPNTGAALLSPDFSQGLFHAVSNKGFSEGADSPYYFIGVDGSVKAASPAVIFESSNAPFESSADSRSIIFAGNTPFGPEEPPVSAFSGYLLHEVVDAGGSSPEVRLVQRRPDGTIVGGECGAWFGSARPATPGHTERHVVSLDGSRVFFGSCGETGLPLFARVDHSQIVEISESECTRIADPTATPPILPCDTATTGEDQFVGAARDGSRVFFLSPRQLANSDTDVGGNDLYEYSFSRPAGEKLVQISRGDGGVGAIDGAGAGVEGVVNISEDGSHVYFVATGILTTSANPQGARAVEGANNFYVYERDAAHPSGKIGFVGALSESDSNLWSPQSPVRSAQSVPADASDGGADDRGGDGHVLVFDSAAQLTSDDTDTAVDVYRFDDQNFGATLQRISIGGPGSAAGNNSSFPSEIEEMGQFPGALRRVATDDGSTIVFKTAEQLVKGDVNSGQDVYRWKQGEVASVSIGTTGGLEHTTIFGPVFEPRSAEISASGKDIYITTSDQLVGQDGDVATDVYDAREEGGFPAPAKSTSCNALSGNCQPSTTPPPVPPANGTSYFSGRGNVADGHDCFGFAEQARKAKRHAAKLRNQAKHAEVPKRSAQLRRRADALSAQARHASSKEKKCRTNRRGAR